MEFSVTTKIENRNIVCEIHAPEANEFTRYAYYLYEASGAVLEKQGYIQNATFSFPLPKAGAYYVKGFVQYKASAKEEHQRKSKKSNTVLYDTTSAHAINDQSAPSNSCSPYPVITLSYEDIASETFQPKEPTVYEILWDGVKFEFLINHVPDTNQAVIFGTGDVVNAESLPIFSRATWMNELPCNGIWYFDPTVYLGESSLGWGYGTNQRWYMENIACLLTHILQKLSLDISNCLFYGSSAGGYTALGLASMLHGRATVINPQLIIPNFWKRLVDRFKSMVLQHGEELIEHRVHILRLFESQQYFPEVHLIQNVKAERDMQKDIVPLIEGITSSALDCQNQLRLEFYSEEGGHSAMPSKESCLRVMLEDLNRPFKEYKFSGTKECPEPTAEAGIAGEVDPVDFVVRAISRISGMGITTEIIEPLGEGIQYAYYLYEKSRGILLRQGYCADKVFTFPLEEYGDGDYYVRAFARIKDSNGEFVKKSTVADACAFRIKAYQGIKLDDLTARIKKIPSVLSGFSDSKVVEAAQNIMSGQMMVFGRLPAFPYDMENVDWQMKPDAMGNTFQLYLQCLNPVIVLLQAYENTKNADYLTFAQKLVRSWAEFSRDERETKENKYIWNDHAMSTRANCLIYFGNMICRGAFEDDAFLEELLGLIYLHGEKLAADTFYTKRHNHGIMQDQALLYIGYLLREERWITRAKERLIEQENWAFDSEMVHTENSPGYAQLVINIFKRLGTFLLDCEDPFGEKLKDDMKRAEEYVHWTTLPNGVTAQIGDTQGMQNKLYTEDRNVPRPVSDDHKLYQKTGIYFYRSNIDELTRNDTWKTIKSGFVQTTHKHADDGSFMLYSKGYEVFVDGGLYGYTADPFRDYFKSALAHNSIVVDNRSYPCTMENKESIGMSAHRFLPEYDHVRVFNHGYEGVHWERDFCSADDLTILMDSVASFEKHTFSQLFHLSEHMEILKADDREVVLKLADSGFVVRLRQYGDPASLSVIRGDKNTPGYGLISRGTNHLDTITTLKFELTGNAGIFATAITIEDPEGFVRLSKNRKEKADQLQYNAKEKTFTLADLTIPVRASINSCSKEISDKSLLGTSSPTQVKVIFTIDTEHAHGGSPIRISGDLRKFGIEENFGISAIMDIFEEFDMRAVFFVNVYEAGNYDPEYASYMEEVLTEIHRRGHEVALHCHQKNSPLFPLNNMALSKMSEEQQIKNFSDGLDYVERVINYRPISFRGGAYRMNSETLRALGKAGIKFDSTCNHLEKRNVLPFWRTINQVFEEDGVIEIPVMHFINSKGSYCRLDLESVSAQDLIDILDDMSVNNFPYAQIMFHSFSLMRRRPAYEGEVPLHQIGEVKAGRSIFGGNPAMKDRLRRILAYLKDSTAHKVVTFEQIQNDIIIPPPESDRIFATHTEMAQRTLADFAAQNYYEPTVGHVVSFSELAKSPDIKIKNGKLCFCLKNSETPPADFKFAFYLMSEETAVQKIGYGVEPKCEFDIPTDGVYYVKSFLDNGKARKSFQTASFIIQNGSILNT